MSWSCFDDLKFFIRSELESIGRLKSEKLHEGTKAYIEGSENSYVNVLNKIKEIERKKYE